EPNQLVHGTVIERNVLRHEADSPACRRIAKGTTEHAARAARRTHEAHREMDSRRLACSIRPKEAEDLAALHRQREAIQRDHAFPPQNPAVLLGDSIELEHGRHGSSSQFPVSSFRFQVASRRRVPLSKSTLNSASFRTKQGICWSGSRSFLSDCAQGSALRASAKASLHSE